jgi:hypothetical protein
MPVSPVAANAVATSAWANSVATSVTKIEADIYVTGQLAIPWAAVTGKPLTFAPALGPAVAAIAYGLPKVDGVAVTGAHADHTHGTPPLPTPAQLAIPWAEVTGKPATFPPSAHKGSHSTGGADALTAADVGAAQALDTPATVDAGKRIYVGTANPTGMSEGDIWVKG